jgi:hypothetical protein
MTSLSAAKETTQLMVGRLYLAFLKEMTPRAMSERYLNTILSSFPINLSALAIK